MGCLLGACSAERRPPEDALIIGQAAEPRSLDPHVVTTTNDFRILAQMYEGLVRFRPGTLEVGPGLAERWTVDDDGRRFTFHLREGVRFHDGSVLDAEAVRFNFERLLDPDHPQAETGPFPMSFLFDRIETISTPDAHTVVFTLSEPFAPFLSNLAYPSGFIVSPAAVREHGRRFGRHPSGTGPYRLRNWERRQWVELERFEGYRGAPARTPRVVFRALTDENARLTAMVAGELDILLEVPADIIGYFRERPGMAVAEATGPHLWFLILNTREPPFDDRRVRQAVNYAIDKESLVRDLLQDTAVVARGAFADAFAWALDPDLEPYPHDPERARALLEEAGAVGARLHLLAPSGGSGMLEPLPMASAIQADLARVGLDVRIEVFEWNTFLARVNAGLTRPGEMAQMAWMTNDPDTLPSLALSSTALPEAGGFNSGFFENAELDELLAAARRTTDLEERAHYYRQADRLIHEEAPWAFVASWRQNAVHRAEVTGLRLEPSFLFDLAGVEKRVVGGGKPYEQAEVGEGAKGAHASSVKASERRRDDSGHAGDRPPLQGLPDGWRFTQGVASLALGCRLLPLRGTGFSIFPGRLLLRGKEGVLPSFDGTGAIQCLDETVSLLAFPPSADVEARGRRDQVLHVPWASESAHLAAAKHRPKGAKGDSPRHRRGNPLVPQTRPEGAGGAWWLRGNNAGDHRPPLQGLPVGWRFTGRLRLWGREGVPPSFDGTLRDEEGEKEEDGDKEEGRG